MLIGMLVGRGANAQLVQKFRVQFFATPESVGLQRRSARHGREQRATMTITTPRITQQVGMCSNVMESFFLKQPAKPEDSMKNGRVHSR